MRPFATATAGLAMTLCAWVMFGSSVGHAQSLVDQVSVSIEPSFSAVTLGEDLDLAIEVTNSGVESLADLVVHIDITALSDSTSVDPEDWTATLSQFAGEIEPGESVTVEWRIQPISAGTFSVYAVVLAADDDSVAASNVLQLSVDDRRSLNPNGILPVAIGAPVVIGALLATQLRLSRRHRPRATDGA